MFPRGKWLNMQSFLVKTTLIIWNSLPWYFMLPACLTVGSFCIGLFSWYQCGIHSLTHPFLHFTCQRLSEFWAASGQCLGAPAQVDARRRVRELVTVSTVYRRTEVQAWWGHRLSTVACFLLYSQPPPNVLTCIFRAYWFLHIRYIGFRKLLSLIP